MDVIEIGSEKLEIDDEQLGRDSSHLGEEGAARQRRQVQVQSFLFLAR